MAYDKKNYGITSREDPLNEALRDAWAKADEANAKRPDGATYTWAPKAAIFVDEEVLPRHGGVDRKLAKDYGAMLDELPPITVQKGTFTLIDGSHRLNGAFELESGTDIIRINEVDVPKKKLREAAFAANVAHGRPLTASEKQEFARLLFESYPNMSVQEVGKRAGISWPTAGKIKDGLADAADRRTVTQTSATGKEYERTIPARAEKPATASKPVTRSADTTQPDPDDDGDSGRSQGAPEPQALGALRLIAIQKLSPTEWLRANDAHREAIEAVIPMVKEFVDGVSLALSPEEVLG